MQVIPDMYLTGRGAYVAPNSMPPFKLLTTHKSSKTNILVSAGIVKAALPSPDPP